MKQRLRVAKQRKTSFEETCGPILMGRDKRNQTREGATEGERKREVVDGGGGRPVEAEKLKRGRGFAMGSRVLLVAVAVGELRSREKPVGAGVAAHCPKS
ncbi:hypothetical protein RJT34_32366 [Clitoria ternatea]|uniref:Uncharacterized protein n=1 Tax=Clitoria ternatea TaxID=43366 RepID=A0AAN9EWU1_CLITE